MARLLFANSQRGRSSNIWNFSRGNIWKCFAASQSSLFPTERTRRRIFQIYQYDPLSLFWRENPQQNRKDRRCCYPSNRLFSSYSPLYDWKKDSFSSLARWKEPSWLHRQTPLGISNPNWIAHRRHMRAPFFLQTTAHQFKRGGGGPYTIFSLLCGRELIVIICKSNSPAKEKREKRTDSDWCSRVDPPWMGAFAVIIGR